MQQKGAIGLVAAERGPHRGARISANELHLWRVGGVRCASEGNPAQLSASQGGICHRIRLVGSSERMKRRGARRAHRVLNFWRTLCKCAPFAAAGGFAALLVAQEEEVLRKQAPFLSKSLEGPFEKVVAIAERMQGHKDWISD